MIGKDNSSEGERDAPISFRCQKCNKPLRVKTEMAAKKIRCPACGCVQMPRTNVNLRKSPQVEQGTPRIDDETRDDGRTCIVCKLNATDGMLRVFWTGQLVSSGSRHIGTRSTLGGYENMHEKTEVYTDLLEYDVFVCTQCIDAKHKNCYTSLWFLFLGLMAGGAGTGILAGIWPVDNERWKDFLAAAITIPFGLAFLLIGAWEWKYRTIAWLFGKQNYEVADQLARAALANELPNETIRDGAVPAEMTPQRLSLKPRNKVKRIVM